MSMAPIIETGVAFEWVFERRAMPPFTGDLEFIPARRETVDITVSRGGDHLLNAVQGTAHALSSVLAFLSWSPPPDKPEPHGTIMKIPGRYTPPEVTIIVPRASPGYLGLFEMRMRCFDSEYAELDQFMRPEFAAKPFPKFHMRFALNGEPRKLLGCFVQGIEDVGDIARVSLSADLFDDGSGWVVSRYYDDEVFIPLLRHDHRVPDAQA